MKYEILLFDLDGTLLDFDKSEIEDFKKLLLAKGIAFEQKIFDLYKEVNEGLWRAYEKGEITMSYLLETRFKKTMEKLGYDIDGAAWEKEYRQYLGDYAFIIDGADEVLKNLHRDHRIFAVTNGVGDTQVNRLKIAGLLDYFEDIFVSQVIGFQKPSVEFFNYAASKIKDFDIKKALIIGDSPVSDILGGINAGIDTCLISLNGKTNTTAYKSNYEINSLMELYDICR